MTTKQFMYFQNTDGGMEVHVATMAELYDRFTDTLYAPWLYGWMRADCRVEDTAMIKWMLDAEVGDTHDHRLGVMVRIKDIK